MPWNFSKFFFFFEINLIRVTRKNFHRTTPKKICCCFPCDCSLRSPRQFEGEKIGKYLKENVRKYTNIQFFSADFFTAAQLKFDLISVNFSMIFSTSKKVMTDDDYKFFSSLFLGIYSTHHDEIPHFNNKNTRLALWRFNSS